MGDKYINKLNPMFFFVKYLSNGYLSDLVAFNATYWFASLVHRSKIPKAHIKEILKTAPRIVISRNHL